MRGGDPANHGLGPGPAACRAHILEPIELRAPFWRYYAAIRAQPYACLLDSAMDPEKLGQFSFLAGDPSLVFQARRQPGRPPEAGARLEVSRRRDPDGTPHDPPVVEISTGDAFAALRELLAAYRVDHDEYRGHPAPFLAGAVGYFGYEAGYLIEALPDTGADTLGLPDIGLMFVDSVLAHCHRTGRSWLSVVGRGRDAAAAHSDALAARDGWLRRLAAFEAEHPDLHVERPAARAAPVVVRAHFDEPGYCRAVQAAQEHIFAGDAYEVCLTHQLEAPCPGDPWALYEELRRVNPAPFAGFLRLADAHVASSSPERFLRLDAARVVESRPIKGTRPRGSTAAADEALRRELAGSVKDRAESAMIVDLVRNDIGRVARFGTVHVPELMIIEGYATVLQMVSTIRGTLEPGVDAVALIKACFPGGSVTGAPKIEVMKIIDRLEPVKRGVYSGSLGYIDFSGALDLNIAIRTLVIKDGRAHFGVGGAIVADSEPRAEYEETLTKAQALIEALRRHAGRAPR